MKCLSSKQSKGGKLTIHPAIESKDEQTYQ